MDERITWDDHIQHYFTQMDIGCMRSRTVPLDLSDYESVKAKAEDIIIQLERRANAQPGQDIGMPKGGRPWPKDKIENFKKWEAAGCPKN